MLLVAAIFGSKNHVFLMLMVLKADLVKSVIGDLIPKVKFNSSSYRAFLSHLVCGATFK